jgi:NAD(P)-dependent dehydrogenase (short-subunit alcohol dehydrogenase family)
VRSVVITGVSRGLGAALFDQLYDHGDRILAIGRGFSPAQQELAEADPKRVLLRRADLTDPRSQPDAVELAEFLGGHPSGHAVLLLNAAVVTPIGAVGTLPADELADSVAVNLTAPMLLTNAFLSAAGSCERRSVLFVSSGAARRVVGGWAAYCAGKAGAAMFFDVVAEQEAGRSYVANVDPGVMDTGMQADIRSATGYFPESRRFHDRYAGGELAEPATVAGMIIQRHLTDW